MNNIFKNGVIVSDKMNKTRVVLIKRYKIHKKYKKNIFYRKKYFAHDKNNFYKIGDKVLIKLIRPLSKKKKWLIIKKFNYDTKTN
ncbi:MAG: 30S ribosomal protein S17 [Candidatus Shikimatogenerans sp. Ttur]|uniref:Small ribosomal subunit protein uS17 n=1 Tax=Candidatus Shikimatogenerans sp. Ttur TaxID=3158569 RepID=A0AAU7ZXI9_9FLAO